MPSLKSWDLQVDPGVYKTLQRISRRDVESLLAVIRLLAKSPSLGDIRKIKGLDDVWRRCIGNYRIFYKLEVSEKIVLVFRVERRTSKTY